MKRKLTFLFTLLASACLAGAAMAQPVNAPVNSAGQLTAASIKPQTLHDSLMQFTGRELALYLKAWGPSTGKPSQLFGEPTGGDFFSTGFAISLGAWAKHSGQTTLAGHDLVTWCRDLIAQDLQGTTFAQLNMLRTLTSFGWKLEENKLWQACSPELRTQLTAMASWQRTVDPKTMEAQGGRPVNYIAVGLLVGAHAWKLGLEKDRTGIDKMMARCIAVMKANNGFLDDDKSGLGRYDRYALEFHRFCWEAAVLMNDKKAKKELLPMVRSGMQLWMDSYNPATGHSAPYGRSLQNVWDDAWEMTAQMAEFPELRVSPLANTASAYVHSWNQYLQRQFNHQTHLNRMLEPGRATYAYAGRNRIFSYTVHAFGKALHAAHDIEAALKKEKVQTIAPAPTLPDVSRLQVFRTQPRIMANWIYRRGDTYFVMPFVGGFKNAGQSDYLPIPYGWPGLESPVSMPYPMLSPQITLPNGMVLVNANGVDSLALSEDGNSLRAFSRIFPNLKGDYVDPGFTLTRQITVEGNLLTEEQTYRTTGTEPAVIAKWNMGLCSHYTSIDLQEGKLTSNGSDYLQPSVEASWQPQATLHTMRTEGKIKGAFAPLSMCIEWVSRDFVLSPGQPYTARIYLRKKSSSVSSPTPSPTSDK